VLIYPPGICTARIKLLLPIVEERHYNEKYQLSECSLSRQILPPLLLQNLFGDELTEIDQTTGRIWPETVGIKRYGITGLIEQLAELGQPAYRTQQLIEWLYGRGITSYDEMSNLPASLRQALADSQPLSYPQVRSRQLSRDGSRKYLLELVDGSCVECVGIPDDRRLTVCFSTQVGCAMDCQFCATGRIGLVRQLAPGEIVDQLTLVSRDFDQRVTNAVAMGEGEPFANYSATVEALRLMNHPSALNIGARHLAVSTCGLLAGIRAFSAEPEQFRLAVSLHSARQYTRDKLMPKLQSQKLPALQQALNNYVDKSGRRVSLEYLLIDGVNDTPPEIEALIDFCRSLHCYLNLIPLNPLAADAHSSYLPTPISRSRAIIQQLTAAGIEATLRRSRGADIAGACGQLAGQSVPG
jgi:23S rRNA (adenine2503-C2)-methyltransferase